VKVSGDSCLSDDFISKLRELSKRYFIVICVGGGTQINQALEKTGLPRTSHGPLGRELPTLKLRQLARDVLEQNQADLQDKLARLKIPATVIIPVLDVGTVLCHVNGDEFLKIAYLGFDRLILITTPDRVENKQKQFSQFPKIEVCSCNN
jgi:acetylglutamate kinase